MQSNNCTKHTTIHQRNLCTIIIPSFQDWKCHHFINILTYMHLIKRYGHASKFLIFWKDHCFPWSNFSFLESEKTACYYLHLFIFKIHLILSLYMQTIKLSSYMYARRENLNHWIKNMPCVDPLYVSQQYIVNNGIMNIKDG